MSASEMPARPHLPSRAAGRRERRTRTRALTRETIVAAAIAIVDTQGLDALTMRSVAQELGTGAASLYAYVSGKEELLELVVDTVIGEVALEPGPADPEHWQEQLKSGLRMIRDVFARHGDLARASFARIPMGENALRGSEWMIGVLRAGGLSDQVIAYACDLLPMYVMAVAYEESIYQSEGNSPEQVAAYIDSMRDYFSALPPERFPNVVALAGPLTAGADETRFEFGLSVLIAGLAAIEL